MPGGTSLKNLEHMGQIWGSDEFRRFDYGDKGNQKVYKDRLPPKIPLDKISVPWAIYPASDDHIGDITDAKNLVNVIPVVADYKVQENEDHLSLVMSKDMNYFRDHVIGIMDKYRSK